MNRYHPVKGDCVHSFPCSCCSRTFLLHFIYRIINFISTGEVMVKGTRVALMRQRISPTSLDLQDWTSYILVTLSAMLEQALYTKPGGHIVNNQMILSQMLGNVPLLEMQHWSCCMLLFWNYNSIKKVRLFLVELGLQFRGASLRN